MNYETTLRAEHCAARRREHSKFSAENYARSASNVSFVIQTTKKLKGPFFGLYSFRVLEYRVIFEIEKPDTIRLLAIRHRKDVYKT